MAPRDHDPVAARAGLAVLDSLQREWDNAILNNLPTQDECDKAEQTYERYRSALHRFGSSGSFSEEELLKMAFVYAIDLEVVQLGIELKTATSLVVSFDVDQVGASTHYPLCKQRQKEILEQHFSLSNAYDERVSHYHGANSGEHRLDVRQLEACIRREQHVGVKISSMLLDEAHGTG
ncbi:hypothetical protein OIV83_005637 [Microbotryomycetes sp. JL201]|nr:hypothetical protein OIV83_005637 [Microbotryomycetes sp. JL201]